MNHTARLELFLAAAAVAFAGCAGGAGTPPTASGVAAPQARTGAHPALCTPTVWASSLGNNAVYGYTAANSTPCVTLTGPYNGLTLNAPITVAIGKNPQRLYVADLNNNRIAVFTYQGRFIKTWSTATGGQLFQPWGVCVSPKGIVGVANRQFNNSGPPGNVEFFLPNAPNNSTPSGVATGIFTSDQILRLRPEGQLLRRRYDVVWAKGRVSRASLRQHACADARGLRFGDGILLGRHVLAYQQPG